MISEFWKGVCAGFVGLLVTELIAIFVSLAFSVGSRKEKPRDDQAEQAWFANSDG